MLSVVRTLFAEKLENDPRGSPLLFFSPPFLGNLGFIGVVYQFWLQVFALGLTNVFINLVAALLAYKFLKGRPNSAISLAVGYGLICPLLVYLPFRLISICDLRNPVLKLVAISNPALLVFRCFETMYDTLPKFATKGRRAFLWYFAASVEFHVDPKTQDVVPTSNREILQKTLSLVILFLECAALFSILVPFDYRPFSSREITNITDAFFYGNMLNTFMMAALTKTTIEFGMSLQALAVTLFSGYSTLDVNVRPLTASTSPSDFWGRRWNRLVSGGLKRGVYKPFRKHGFSRPFAALATFGASGLLHEYFLAAITFGGNEPRDPDDSHSLAAPHYTGGHLIFFLWNAVVLVLDGLCRETRPIRLLEKSLPQLLRTALVLMTVLPTAHFFLDQFMSLGVYSGFSLGYPRIIPLDIMTNPTNW